MARGAQSARALLACAIGVLALLGTADAQTQRTAAQAERDRRAESARAERLRGEAAAARRDIRTLDRRLAEAERRRREAEDAAAAAEERLAALRLQIEAESAARSRAHGALERALIAAAFAERRLEPRAVRAGIFARAAAPAFQTQARRSGQALAEARALEAAIATEQAQLAEAQGAIETERAEIDTLLARRRTAQRQLTAQAVAAERRARALAAEARNLRELTQRVRRPASPPAAGGASVVPAAWVAPASGRIVRGYGAREGAGPATQGVTVRTAAGARVVAPASGEVAYAGEFRSYGQVLILNLEGGYALVLTGLDVVRARVGETVRAGQIVGQMSDSATPAPDLYVEVRQGGQPVDPGRWLSARGLTAEAGVRAG